MINPLLPGVKNGTLFFQQEGDHGKQADILGKFRLLGDAGHIAAFPPDGSQPVPDFLFILFQDHPVVQEGEDSHDREGQDQPVIQHEDGCEGDDGGEQVFAQILHEVHHAFEAVVVAVGRVLGALVQIQGFRLFQHRIIHAHGLRHPLMDDVHADIDIPGPDQAAGNGSAEREGKGYECGDDDDHDQPMLLFRHGQVNCDRVHDELGQETAKVTLDRSTEQIREGQQEHNGAVLSHPVQHKTGIGPETEVPVQGIVFTFFECHQFRSLKNRIDT